MFRALAHQYRIPPTQPAEPPSPPSSLLQKLGGKGREVIVGIIGHSNRKVFGVVLDGNSASKK